MKKIATLTALFVLLSTIPVSAEPLASADSPKSRLTWWKVTSVALVAAVALDAHSSWGMQEQNPLLRGQNGRFGMRGVAIKALVAGGTLTAQYLLLRKKPEAQKFGILTNV